VTEQRKARRFELRLPVDLVRVGSLTVNKAIETRNLSSSGVLFATEASFPIGEAIEYLITLPVKTDGANQVRLRCVGKVVRHQGPASAATLERYEFMRG
jgi:hypothetical protein